MALPEPTINIDDLLVGSSNPALDVANREGSVIRSIERPYIESPYSPDNLPEFMKGFEQVTPTTFAPVIGGLTTAGLTPEEIALQEQREQAFKESIAIDPTMFGGGYQPSLYIPIEQMPTYTEEDTFDLAGTLAAAEALKQAYPYISEGLGEAGEAIKRGVIDPVEEFVQQNVLEPTEEFVQQKVLDPAEEAFKAVADPVEEAVQQYVLDPTEDVLKAPLQAAEKALEPVVEAIDIAIDTPEPIKKIEDVAKVIPEKLDEFVQTPETIKAFENSAKSFLDTLPEATTNLAGAYADVENMIDNPSGVNVDKAVEAINDIAFDVGATAPIVPPAIGGVLHDAGSVAAIVDAFENPDAESLTNAYAAVDDLAMNYAGDGTGIVGGEAVGTIGNILTGLEDLEGGIESPAEAVNVVNAANTVAGLVNTGGNFATAGTSGFLGANIGAALSGVGTFVAAASALKAVNKALKGGAAGNYPRVQGDFLIQDGKFTSKGVRASDVSKLASNTQWAKETANSATSMANSLVDDYGFEIDEQALKAAPENIMRLQSSTYYNRQGRKQYGSALGSADFVVKLLQNGVLKPTENTPPEILASNEAFASFITDHLDKGQDEYAAKIYSQTSGTGAEHSSRTRTQGNVVRQRAKFATQDAAQSWADENETPVSYSTTRANYGGRVTSYYKNQVTYDVVPVEVGGKTYYELKKNDIKQKISKAAYNEATKPKPEPKPKPQPTYDLPDVLAGIDFSKFDFSKFPIGPLF